MFLPQMADPHSYRPNFSEPCIPGPAREMVNPSSDDFFSQASASIKNSGIMSILSNIFSSTPHENCQNKVSQTLSSTIMCEQIFTNVQSMYLSDNQPSHFHN